MCEPITMAAITAGGAATQAYGQYQAGQAANSAARFNAQQLEQNARVADNRANDALFRGGFEVDKIRRQGADLQAEQRTGFAAGNVDLSTGTPVFAELDTANTVAGDVGMTKYNTQMEAYGFRTDAWNARSQAKITRFEGKQAKRAGEIGAVGSLLSGAGQSATAYKTFS
jgi:hypothetical protein